MTENPDRDGDVSASSPVPVFATPPTPGRRRLVATIVGGALLFAGGAGTGAVVSSSLSTSTATTQTLTGQGAPGGAGGQAPNGTAPTGAPPGGAPGAGGGTATS